MRPPVQRIGSLPPVRISRGTVLTVAVIAVMVHPAIVMRVGSPGTALLLAVGVGLSVIASVLLHELAHALTATLAGASVDHIALTLWGGHTQYRGREVGPLPSILISLAGPAANAAIALATGFAAPLTAGPLAVLLSMVCTLSIALAVFNLLPGLPMDGGRALEALIGAITRHRTRGTVITAWIGRGIAAVVLVLPLLRLSRAPGSMDLVVALWSLVIAGLLWQGAGSALAGARTEERIERLDPRRLLRPVLILAPGAVAADIPPSIESSQVLVIDAEGMGHRLDLRALAAVPAAARERTPVSALTTSAGPIGRLRAGDGGRETVARMVREPYELYLMVDDDGQVMGCISRADVGALLR